MVMEMFDSKNLTLKIVAGGFFKELEVNVIYEEFILLSRKLTL